MIIQSVSIVVPATNCINKCKFCVARTNHDNSVDNFITYNNMYFSLYYKQYKDRLEYGRDNGCNSIILTGDCEPQQNKQFLMLFGIMNDSLSKPYRHIEMQTTGTLIDDDYLFFLRHTVGVTTMSLSISSLDRDKNNEIIAPAKTINAEYLSSRIKKYQFVLRVSINLSKHTFDTDNYEEIFNNIKEKYNADQVTFRVLYDGGSDMPQDVWVRENRISDEFVEGLNKYIKDNGEFLGKLEFGADKYSIHGMTTVVDDDCMSTTGKEAIKFAIIYPNCRMYSRWGDFGSLIL